MKYDVNAKSLNCPNCGAPLSIPKNTTGVVYCESCGGRCVLSGLNVNDEILKKNNINSGIPLQESSDKIHTTIVDFITTSKNFPIDVLENAVITEEKHLCVPAYLFTCSAFASYSYEAGNRRVSNGKSYTEWTQMSAIANDTKTVVVCGNSKYMDVINSFYSNLDPARLIDVEELNYPDDADAETFNVPYASAFSTYVKPAIDNSIKETALSTLKGRSYRNFTIGQPNIQKEYEARISLGLFLVTLEYKGQAIYFYFNSDATSFMPCATAPEDYARTEYIKSLRQQRSNIRSSWFSDLFHGGFAKANEISGEKKQERQEINQTINGIQNEPAKAKDYFNRQRCRLKGIYSDGTREFSWKSEYPDVPLTTNPFNTTGEKTVINNSTSSTSNKYAVNSSNTTAGYQSPAPKSNSNLLWWILGWIFFFPAPLMILIWRKKNTWNTPTKIIVTVLIWVVILAYGSCNRRTGNTTKSSTPTVTTITQAADDQ